MIRNEKGFSKILIFLVLIILIVIVGAVYNTYRHKQKDKTVVKTSDTKQSLAHFTDPTNLYSIDYPTGWVVRDLGPSELTYGGMALKSNNVAINYPGGPEDFDPVYISSDETPSQAQQTISAWEAGAKNEPFSTISIDGHKTLYRHIQSDIGREDSYLIINEDQSSVYFLITSRKYSPHKDDINYDATDKLTDFIAIVNSTKFLR